MSRLTRLALVAGLALAASGPLTSTATAKCVEPMSLVCSAVVIVCNEADKVRPTQLCDIQP